MPENAPPAQPPPKQKSRLPFTLALVIGVAVVEGAGFFVATKFFGGGPTVAYGEGEREGHLLQGDEPGSKPQAAEVPVLESFRAPNDRRGRLYIYDFDVVIKVPASRTEEAKQFLTDRKGEVSDRIARIVRAADPAVLHEPELTTLRMQIQHAIGEIAGDPDMVVEVLIPRCVPIRAD
jgi:flagellar basal body-associated protein FliL